jgi:hypothetical protein
VIVKANGPQTYRLISHAYFEPEALAAGTELSPMIKRELWRKNRRYVLDAAEAEVGKELLHALREGKTWVLTQQQLKRLYWQVYWHMRRSFLGTIERVRREAPLHPQEGFEALLRIDVLHLRFKAPLSWRYTIHLASGNAEFQPLLVGLVEPAAV